MSIEIGVLLPFLLILHRLMGFGTLQIVQLRGVCFCLFQGFTLLHLLRVCISQGSRRAEASRLMWLKTFRAKLLHDW